jgi:hypothetical protein
MKTVTLQIAKLEKVKRRAREAFKGKKQGSRITFASAQLLFRRKSAGGAPYGTCSPDVARAHPGYEASR